MTAVTIDIDNNQAPCYVLKFKDDQTYVALDFWCSGLERWQGVDITNASRFTNEAARIRCQQGGTSYGNYMGDDIDVEPEELEIEYIPWFDPRQTRLF